MVYIHSMPSTLTKPREVKRKRVRDLQETIQKLSNELRKILQKDPELAVESGPPRPSPLDSLQQVVDATADLREPNGNLSARKIADLFGISMNQLASWLGRSRQTLTKTPDADSLQPDLGFFERVARLRAVLRNDDDFRKWLRMAHPDVVAKNPLELMAKGEWQALADFVDDILSGTPG
jgi:hypothetical protein